MAFLRRRWLLGPRMRINLPLPLYLNRLAVALWVLILGTCNLLKCLATHKTGDVSVPRRYLANCSLLYCRSDLDFSNLEREDSLFLGGGIIRNLVWDYLHGYKSYTPIDDVDVIYFDQLSNTKNHDIVFEEKLNKAIPNLVWSVKNQARMHTINNDEQYQSIHEAISKWPETATAILARLSEEGQLKLIAPHGYTDLFRLLVVPTPRFEQKIDKYRERINKKNWKQTWPNLKLIGLGD